MLSIVVHIEFGHQRVQQSCILAQRICLNSQMGWPASQVGSRTGCQDAATMSLTEASSVTRFESSDILVNCPDRGRVPFNRFFGYISIIALSLESSLNLITTVHSMLG